MSRKEGSSQTLQEEKNLRRVQTPSEKVSNPSRTGMLFAPCVFRLANQS